MLLFYLDEFGNESLTASSIQNHPYFAMGSMCIRDTQRLSLCEQLRKLKDDFFPGWRQKDWSESEIKGRYLAQAVRRHMNGSPPLHPYAYRNLIGGNLGRFIDRLFNIVHRFSPTFYFVAVDKASLITRHPHDPFSPVGLAYAHLQLRSALLIAEVYGRSEGGVFLADEENHHESLFRKGVINQVRNDITQRLPFPANIELLLDKPLWINRGELNVEREITQLADFGLYIVGTAILKNFWRPSNQWLGRLSPYIARHWKTGAVWDGGITITPRPTRYPRFLY